MIQILQLNSKNATKELRVFKTKRDFVNEIQAQQVITFKSMTSISRGSVELLAVLIKEEVAIAVPHLENSLMLEIVAGEQLDFYMKS